MDPAGYRRHWRNTTAKESHALLTKALELQEGRTPLHHALEIGQIEVTVMLLEAKADVNATDNVRRWGMCLIVLLLLQ